MRYCPDTCNNWLEIVRLTLSGGLVLAVSTHVHRHVNITLCVHGWKSGARNTIGRLRCVCLASRLACWLWLLGVSTHVHRHGNRTLYARMGENTHQVYYSVYTSQRCDVFHIWIPQKVEDGWSERTKHWHPGKPGQQLHCTAHHHLKRTARGPFTFQ